MIKWFMDAVRRAQKNLYALALVLFVGAALVAPQRVWRKTLAQLQQPARLSRARLLRSRRAHS
jgi:hypothetical protein